MTTKIQIADSELPIMKILWAYGEMTSPEIFAHLEGNKSTLKTLLQRLVGKGAVSATEITSRSNMYAAQISREEYTNSTRKNFMQKVFDGSREKMLLNFVQEENFTKDDIEKLLALIDEN